MFEGINGLVRLSGAMGRSCRIRFPVHGSLPGGVDAVQDFFVGRFLGVRLPNDSNQRGEGRYIRLVLRTALLVVAEVLGADEGLR